MEPIRDYKLEELLRGSPTGDRKREQAGAALPSRLNWRQLSQYALSHAINDYYALSPLARHPQLFPALLERRWTNRSSAFSSEEHFVRVRQRLGSEMVRLLERQCGIEPLLRFEQWETFQVELQRSLSMIFQIVLAAEDGAAANEGAASRSRLDNDGCPWSGQRYVVQKYVVNDDEELLRAFCHYTVAFCSSAFPHLPERVEIYSLLTGHSEVMRPTAASLQQSIDYVGLVLSLCPAELASCGMSLGNGMSWIN